MTTDASIERAEVPRLEALDIVRGIAALAVVLFHYSVVMPRFVSGVETIPLVMRYGFYGVHLFFVVSGFVILMSLEHSGPRKFLISRFARLYPVYWLVCGLTFGILTATAVYHYPVRFSDFLINLTMLQDYLKVMPVDGAHWSLAYELGFYIFIFAIFFLGLKRYLPMLPIYMVFGSLLFYFCASYIVHPLHMLLMAHQYAHFFGCGLALYLLRTRGHSWLYWPVLLATPLVQSLYDGWTGLIAGQVIVVLTSVACLARMSAGRKMRPLIWLGSISYALYLIHQMLGYAAIAWLQKAMGWSAWSSTLGTLTGALMLAHVLTYYWERPIAAWLKQRLSGRSGTARRDPGADLPLAPAPWSSEKP